jgi:hypothetical protein
MGALAEIDAAAEAMERIKTRLIVFGDMTNL